jgi:hypothetical protein
MRLSKNKSVKIAFLSVLASFIQLTAYGLGFMQDFWKRVIIKQLVNKICITPFL